MKTYVIRCRVDDAALHVAVNAKLQHAVDIAIRLGGKVLGYVDDVPSWQDARREVEKELAWASQTGETK